MAGIIEIVIHEPASRIFREVAHYSQTWQEGHKVTETMLCEAGVSVRVLSQFVGKTAYIGGKKYEI